MKLELFMTIPGYENYKVSTHGKVFSIRRNKELKPFTKSGGYYQVDLSKNRKHKKFLIHRLVALTFLNEDITNKLIDHIDGNPKNNFFQNLRVCSQQQNLLNRGKNKNNKSGFKGVFWNKQQQKWTSNIFIDGKQKYLGLFNKKEAAYEAYKKAAREYHGEYCYQYL